MSRQALPDVDIQLRNLVATLSLFVSADLLHSSYVLSRHSSFSIFNPLCCDRRNIIVTDFLSHLLRRLSRHTELCRDIDFCNCSFSLLSR